MKYLLLSLVAWLVGCAANLPADPTKMSPEQLKAMASDKSATAACTTVNSPWGVGRSIYVQLDKSSIAAGTVTVDSECKVTLTADPKPVAPAKAASAP